MAFKQWGPAKLCGVEQSSPSIFGRAAITFGIGPHSSLFNFYVAPLFFSYSWCATKCYDEDATFENVPKHRRQSRELHGTVEDTVALRPILPRPRHHCPHSHHVPVTNRPHDFHTHPRPHLRECIRELHFVCLLRIKL